MGIEKTLPSGSGTSSRRYPRRSGSGSGLFTKEKNEHRRADRRATQRFRERGYCPDERGNYPCLCERELDYNPIWWVSDSQSRGPHLFCLRCTSRFLPHEIDEALTKWNIKQKVVHVDFNIKNLKESL